MTDFLSSIAAKAVGTVPLIEPRLPSRFEAVMENDSPSDTEADASIETAGKDQFDWAGSPLHHILTRTVLPTGSPPQTTLGETIAGPSLPHSVAQSLVPKALPHDDRIPVIAPARTITEPEDDMPPRRQTSRSIPVAPVVPAVPERERHEILVRELVRESPPPALLMPQPMPAMASPGSQQETALPNHRIPETIMATPVAPVITVTIGRIDIRAHVTTPTAPPRPQQTPRADPQSLSDYLRRRDGGR